MEKKMRDEEAKSASVDEQLTVGDVSFSPDDYSSPDSLSQGLATTHEQVSDTYTAGTSDGIAIDEDGEIRVNPKSSKRPPLF